MSGDMSIFEQQSLLATSFLPADLRQNIITRVNEVDTKIRESTQVITLNVGGMKYMVQLKNFVRYPTTRLGRLARAQNRVEVLSLCDYWSEGDPPEYFFDRSFAGFNSILDLYRLGSLHLSDNLCALVTKMELDYWMMDELLLEPCCALKFYPEMELCHKEVASGLADEMKDAERRRLEQFGDGVLGRVRTKLWNLTEYPETSTSAQVAAFFSLGVVVLSTLCFILSTFPEFQDPEEDDKSPFVIMFQTTLSSTSKTSTDSSINEDTATSSSSPDPQLYYPSAIIALNVIDVLTVFYFTLEYLVRFLCSPCKRKFFFSPMNLVDLFAVLPYFISLVVESLQDIHIIGSGLGRDLISTIFGRTGGCKGSSIPASESSTIKRRIPSSEPWTTEPGKAGKIMRLVRVMRIMRIFKLVRHFAGLQSLLYTLKQAYKELGLLFLLVFVSVLTFSSLVYFAEKDVPDHSWTFLDSFWWGMMTLTTVGYGDISPNTIVGKAIGGCCALIGVFILTLPVPIVVNSFASYYKNRLWRNEVAQKKKERAATKKTEVIKIMEDQNIVVPH